MTTKTKHLDIGCGGIPRNPYASNELHGLDLKLRKNADYGNITMHEGDAIFNKLPFEDGSFSSVSAYDFLEHIPRVIYVDGEAIFPFVNFMSEVYRILKPGGKFFALTPYYPRESCFSDPTHVNFITKSSHQYFCKPDCWAKMYGFEGEFYAHKIKSVNFYAEVTPPKNMFKRILYTLFVNSYTKSKQHMLWELYKK